MQRLPERSFREILLTHHATKAVDIIPGNECRSAVTAVDTPQCPLAVGVATVSTAMKVGSAFAFTTIHCL